MRVSIVDSERGRLGTAVAEYPLHRKREDPDYATQSHADHMRALAAATRKAVAAAGIDGDAGRSHRPRHHRLQRRPRRRGHAAARRVLPLVRPSRPRGGRSRSPRSPTPKTSKPSSGAAASTRHEWGFAKLLHWLRHNPDKRDQFATALEHCDMVAATLCGITDPRQVKRSVCAMGHKWMWNPKWGGLPPQEFLSEVDPLFDGVRDKLGGDYLTSDHLAGHSGAGVGRASWACAPASPFLSAPSTPIGTPSAPACREGDVVNVVGTSTCIIAMARQTELIPGVCGVVPGSVHPAATPASRPASRPPAISSTPSRGAPASTSPRSPRAWRTIAPARPACCA